MNAMPVLTDKVLPALGLYSVPFVSSCETGKLLQTPNPRCDDLPLCHSCCSSQYIRAGLLCSAESPHSLGGLKKRQSNPNVNISFILPNSITDLISYWPRGE